MTHKTVTVLSNASIEHFPDNKISNFRNRLVIPITLPLGTYEVALTGCSYDALDTVVYDNEIIGEFITSGRKKIIRAPFSFTGFDQLFTFIRDNFSYAIKLDPYGFVTVSSPSNKDDKLIFSKRLCHVLGIWEVRPSQGNNKSISGTAFTGSSDPLKFPIHYDVDDVMLTQYIEDNPPHKAGPGVTDPTGVLNTFNGQIEKALQDKMIKDAVKIDSHTWRVTYWNWNRLSWTDAMETIEKKHDDGSQTVLVQYLKGDLFLRKGDVLWRNNITGERFICPTDVSSYDDALKMLENLQGFSYFVTRTGQVALVPKDTKSVKEYSFRTKMKIYLGAVNGLTEIDYSLASYDHYTGAYRPARNLGRTQLFFYCDLIYPQYVGDTVAPLLKTFPIKYDRAEHVFPNPCYYEVCKDYVDTIHVYIRCENGEPPPFEFRTFCATLEIRKRRDYGSLY